MWFQDNQNALSFYSIINVFQKIFDALSNYIYYEGRFNYPYLNHKIFMNFK